MPENLQKRQLGRLFDCCGRDCCNQPVAQPELAFHPLFERAGNHDRILVIVGFDELGASDRAGAIDAVKPVMRHPYKPPRGAGFVTAIGEAEIHKGYKDARHSRICATSHFFNIGYSSSAAGVGADGMSREIPVVKTGGESPGPEPQPEPHRRAPRRPVTLDGLAIRGDGQTIDISLLDLTYEGCGVSTPVELDAGENLRLSVIGRGLIDAEVRWCRDGKAGLRFASDEPLPKSETPRTTDRVNLSTEVKCRRIGQPNFSVRMFDLSPDGCKIEVIERPRIGEQLMLKFEGLEVIQAEVMWIEDFIVGLRFERAFHPAVFDLLLARLAAA